MIKFLLGFVTLVVVLLATYMFTNKSNETPKKITITKVEKKDVSTEQVEVSKVKKLKAPNKKVSSGGKSPQNAVKSISKVNQTETTNIGEGLTLEGIKNADVSDEEKERLLGELVSYEIYKVRNEPSVAPEEDLERLKQIIEKNLK